MDVISYLKGIDPTISAVLITGAFGFFAWLVKSLIESPIESARSTFYSFLSHRIQIATEIKNTLTFLLLEPGKEAEHKDNLRKILLRDGMTVYIKRGMQADIVELVTSETVQKHKVEQLIREINNELDTSIGKVTEENRYFKYFYSPHPFKRMFIFGLLALSYTIIILLLFALVGGWCYLFIMGSYWGNGALLLLTSILIWGLYRKLNGKSNGNKSSKND